MLEVRGDAAVRQLHAALEELAPLVTEHALESERAARLAAPVVAGLIEHGLLRLWIPRACGGFELELAQALAIYERAAAIDGSFGFAVMIGAGGGLFGAYLRPQPAREIFSPREAVIAGSGAPDGRAERVAGGYRVSGRWRYASGAHYASRFTANCVVTSAGTAVRDANGQPLIRAMAFTPAQVRIIENWDAVGMRATGSHDIAVTDVSVAEEYTFSLASEERHEPGALYRLPFEVLTELPVAAVTLGIARHALAEFARLAKHKHPAHSATLLAADPAFAARYAESRAMQVMASAALAHLSREAWEAALADRPLSQAERAGITAGCALAVARLREAVGALMPFAGMTAIMAAHPLARAWRDLQAVAAHTSVAPLHFAAAGAELLR